MKCRTTQKEIRYNFDKIICIPYCGLQSLLRYQNPFAYTVRREGWAADIYDMGGGVAITTGYAPFGKIRPPYETMQRYEKQAEELCNLYPFTLTYEDLKGKLYKLSQEFIKEVV